PTAAIACSGLLDITAGPPRAAKRMTSTIKMPRATSQNLARLRRPSGLNNRFIIVVPLSCLRSGCRRAYGWPMRSYRMSILQPNEVDMTIGRDSRPRAVGVPPGPLEGQPPGMRGDELGDRFRSP